MIIDVGFHSWPPFIPAWHVAEPRDWDALDGSLRPRLRRAAMRVPLGHVEDAEDAVQDALLRAWRGRQTLRDEESLDGWLFSVLRHVALDRRRRRTIR